jgi:hypothetical protein
MSRRSDPERLQHAKLYGSVVGVRDKVMLADPAVIARHRAELPDLWDRIDQLLDLASGDRPPQGGQIATRQP